MRFQVDRATARALVDAGYMPLDKYLRRFGSDAAEFYPAKPASAWSGRPSTEPPVNAESVAKARRHRTAA